MREQQRKQVAGRKPLALILITALLIGILLVNQATAIKAAQTSASAAGTYRAGYGLNNPSTDSDGVTTWDYVWFGNYWQEDTNGDGKADESDAKTPIKWRVLSVNGDDAFLLADQNLDCQEYNDTWVNVTWETCTMRSWLNGYGAGANVCETDYSADNFLDNAFNTSEQAAIKNTTVSNEDNPYYDTEGGNNTTDKVYLLSLSEVMNPSYGFHSDPYEYAESRRAKNTAYAKGQGAWTYAGGEYAGNGYWWLRSPGINSNYACYVYDDGSVNETGHYVNNDDYAVRPALHLNLGALSEALSTSVSAKAPGKVTALKIKAKKKAIQASWKKVSGASGYQIWYSTSKKFGKKSAKTTKKTKLTIKKLKSGKAYFVKVRAYTVRNGKKIYGAWSKAVKKKVK